MIYNLEKCKWNSVRNVLFYDHVSFLINLMINKHTSYIIVLQIWSTAARKHHTVMEKWPPFQKRVENSCTRWSQHHWRFFYWMFTVHLHKNVNNNFQRMHFSYIYYISQYSVSIVWQAGSRYNNHREKRLTITAFYNF